MSEKIYKFGLIGVGRWGKNFVKTIEAMEGVEIAHICTSKPENAKLFKKKPRVSKDYKSLCTDFALDGVIICTPPSTHMEIIYECICNLKPFLVEKPMCMNLMDAKAIRDTVKYTRVPCMVDHTHLFSPAWEEMVYRMKKEKILSINSKAYAFGPFRKDVPMLWDWAPHDIAMCVELMKEMPTRVQASYVPNENYDNSGEINIALYFKNLTANILINNASENKYRAFVASSDYLTFSIFCDELFETRSGKCTQQKITLETPLKRLIDNFILAIETQNYEGLDLGVNVVNIIEKCRKSIENNAELINI